MIGPWRLSTFAATGRCCINSPNRSIRCAQTPGVVVRGRDTIDEFQLSAHFDRSAKEIGGVEIPDATSGLIRLLNASVGRCQDC